MLMVDPPEGYQAKDRARRGNGGDLTDEADGDAVGGIVQQLRSGAGAVAADGELGVHDETVAPRPPWKPAVRVRSGHPGRSTR